MPLRCALDSKEKRIIPAYSGQRALCPSCQNTVVAHCGEIRAWHWQHLAGHDCDPWAEPLTEWHIVWQTYFEKHKNAKAEEPITHSGITHRADAVLWNGDGDIIELQHSSISTDEIKERERFYGKKLIWIFDVREAYASRRFEFRKKDGMKRTFRWKQPWKSIAFAKRRVFLDLGDGYMFQLSKLYPDAPCGGFGLLHLSFRVEEETKTEI